MTESRASPRQFDLIVFDWDGTLFDSTALITRCIQAACVDLDVPRPSDRDASYVIGMGFLFLHVSHGFQSMFQTFGLSNDRTLPVMGNVSKLVGLVLLVGYASIPLLIILGIIR